MSLVGVSRMCGVIKAVLFDLDGTLLDRATSLVVFVEQQYQRIEALQSISKEQFVSSVVALDRNGHVWKDEVYRQLIARYGIQGVTWEMLLQDYVENFAIACVGFPHMREMLVALIAEDYVLGIITNGRSPFQERNIQALGIESLFSTILVSQAVGLRKPDPAIFKKALHCLGVQASETVFVGDNPQADIEGARQIGMKAIWKRSTDEGTCPGADATCDNLIDLPAIIRQL